MRFAVPALVAAAAAAFSGPAAAQHPAVLPALVAAEVIGGLALGAAEAGPGLRGGYHAHHGYGYGAPAGGAYVQYYDPRSGVPVGGPVPVGEREFQRRAASVPYDAPRIHVRPDLRFRTYDAEPVLRGPRVVEERIEPVMRGPRYAHGFGYRHLRHGYGMGPRYGHVPRVAYGPRYGYGARHAGPGFVYGGRPAYAPRYGYGPRPAYGPRYAPRYGHGPRVLYGPRAYHGWRVDGHGPRAMRHHGPGFRPAPPPRLHAAPPSHRAPRGERSLEQMWNPGGQRRG
jgi:hypothetical protein